MDAPHEKDSPQLGPPVTIAVASAASSDMPTPSDSPTATPFLTLPTNLPSPTTMSFHFANGSSVQHRQRVDSVSSSARQSSEALAFPARPRSAGSPLNPARAAPWASRDSAFSPPPLRVVSTYTDAASVHKAPEKAAIMKSTMLHREADGKINIDKPWTEKKDPYIRISYILTYGFMFLGT